MGLASCGLHPSEHAAPGEGQKYGAPHDQSHQLGTESGYGAYGMPGEGSRPRLHHLGWLRLCVLRCLGRPHRCALLRRQSVQGFVYGHPIGDQVAEVRNVHVCRVSLLAGRCGWGLSL